MKITYNKNPLYTTIELNQVEKQQFWYKIKMEEMEEMLFNAHFHLKEGKYFDLDKARKTLDPKYYCTDEKSPIDKRADEMLEYYLEELKSKHAGDCTCIPCSCCKCHAEDLLGINTMKGLGKHSAYKIDAAFGPNNEKTIDEAIEELTNYEPTKGECWDKYPQEEFDKHIPRWKEQDKAALTWLINYKKEFLTEKDE